MTRALSSAVARRGQGGRFFLCSSHPLLIAYCFGSVTSYEAWEVALVVAAEEVKPGFSVLGWLGFQKAAAVAGGGKPELTGSMPACRG